MTLTIKPRVFIGIPHRNGISSGTHAACWSRGNNHEIVDCQTYQSSLLAFCFNHIWCSALNMRLQSEIDYFVMMHDDIAPMEQGWLDQMIEEIQSTKADILGVVAPIKDDRGLTSTAVHDPHKRTMRRLTMTEIMAFPGTFDADAIGFTGHDLMINTGLWICDFRKCREVQNPWIENICFTVKDRIIRCPKSDGKMEFVPQSFSEDWNFSLDAIRMGCKIFATSKVKLIHYGEFKYPNFAVWGGWQTDQATQSWIPPEIEDNYPRPLYEPAA